jgi:peptidoglycan/LPS O-acetylase OafA/YrhL
MNEPTPGGSRSGIGVNNFDLLRLVAALQVAVLHVMHSLSTSYSATLPAVLLELFPGVPIFFFVSGFLISRSFERSSSLGDYASNRGLRIFPALHVCVLINLLAVVATGYFVTQGVGFLQVLTLYLAKTTFFQFYNPDFMRGFGDGVLNGSLWTVCVELQFYFLTPIIYAVLKPGRNRWGDLGIVVLLLVSLACNRALYQMQADYAHSIAWKLLRVSFLPWLYMFLTGVLAQRHFGSIVRLLTPRAFWFAFIGYGTYAFVMRSNGFGMDNSFSPLLFFPLAFLACTAAFYPLKKRDALRGHDISYGIYLYHVPVMNMFLFYGLTDNLVYTAFTVLISIALAILSWMLIERPSLRKKRRSIHRVPVPGTH